MRIKDITKDITMYYMTKPEIAQYFTVSLGTVYRYIREEGFPETEHRNAAGTKQWTKEAVDSWVTNWVAKPGCKRIAAIVRVDARIAREAALKPKEPVTDYQEEDTTIVPSLLDNSPADTQPPILVTEVVVGPAEPPMTRRDHYILAVLPLVKQEGISVDAFINKVVVTADRFMLTADNLEMVPKSST